MLAQDAVLLFEIREIRDGLDGLAQAHIIGQDAVGFPVGEPDHPLQRLQLVFLQLAAIEQHGLRDLIVAAVFVEKVEVLPALHGLFDLFQQLLQLAQGVAAGLLAWDGATHFKLLFPKI